MPVFLKEMAKELTRIRLAVTALVPILQILDIDLAASKRVYQNIKISPDGRMVAYVTNQKGQYKLWIHDEATDKQKRIYKRGEKLDQINDYSFPEIAWDELDPGYPWEEMDGYYDELWPRTGNLIPLLADLPLMTR